MRRRGQRILWLAAAFAATLVAAPAGARVRWFVPDDFPTIQEAVDGAEVLEGDLIVVRRGFRMGAVVAKRVVLKGRRRTRIIGGPQLRPDLPYQAGFLLAPDGAADGVVIKRFRFKRVDFPVYSLNNDDVKVKRCVLRKPLQGITNWGGSGWRIRGNRIKKLCAKGGGAIGIVIGDYLAVTAGVRDNRVLRNRIKKALIIEEDPFTPYRGSGVALFADSREGGLGAVAVAGNKVKYNRIKIWSEEPWKVDVAAIDLSELDDPEPDEHVIRDNRIKRNRLAGSPLPFAFTPPGLMDVNVIRRNRLSAPLEASAPKPGPAPIR